MTQFAELQGHILTKVWQSGEDELHFETNQGKHFILYHGQDCCESVVIESITGELADLIGTPIILAEESMSKNDPPGFIAPDDYFRGESQTWTFYKLRTIKGSVDIRWYGISNGYYSEQVDFEEVK